MVVIGHSQGGLLTKLISIDSGTSIWDAISDKPVAELNLKPETRRLLKEALFVRHLPLVETVIFIATPHGGSYQASLTNVGLFRRLGRLPPIAPGIHAHSIIPTLQDGPLMDRDDGVVQYKSARIDGMESEPVIEHPDHSTQSNPFAVREVRRILLDELRDPAMQ